MMRCVLLFDGSLMFLLFCFCMPLSASVCSFLFSLFRPLGYSDDSGGKQEFIDAV